MPSPLAHPAASIPFTRAGLVFSALVVGSISPDFGYFIDLPTAYYMYTLPGLILFDVPVAFVLLWLFHVLFKWPFLTALPESLQRRLVRPALGFTFGPARRFGLILLSLLAGSLTHVVWDSFTHEYGWAVEHIGFLRTIVAGMPLYDVLQEVSTVVGLAVLGYWLVKWLRTAPQSDTLPRGFSGRIRAAFFGLGALCLAAVEGTILYMRFTTGTRLTGAHFLLRSTIFSALLIITFFVGAYCLAWMLAFRKGLRRLS